MLFRSKLDREVERLYRQFKAEGKEGMDITMAIENNMNIENVLKNSSPKWDGGYVICGLTGSGDSFTFRDPWGIRPAFYHIDDEIAVIASERPVIQTAFGVDFDTVKELEPGQGIIINKKGEVTLSQINAPKEIKKCSFERIYFSRGSDADIYQERKKLGKNLVPAILDSVDNDIDHTVFSFIPNTAEVAYYGMIEGLNNYLNHWKQKEILHVMGNGNTLSGDDKSELVKHILDLKVRGEKVALKDIKLRTFIAEGNSRNDLGSDD